MVDIKTEILKQKLLDSECAKPIRQASRTRSSGEIVKSLVVSGVIEFLIWNWLGAEKKVEISKTKPTGIFFKENPFSVNNIYCIEKTGNSLLILSAPVLFVCVCCF